MDQTRITKCPKCDTTFRVTASQLSAAKGAVRCGACLHVFRASDYFQQEKPTVTASPDDRTQDMFDDELFETPAAPANKAKPAPPAMDDLDDDFLIDDDNGLIDDNEKPKGSAFLNDIDENFLSINPDAVEDPFFSDSDKVLGDRKEEEEDADEAWAQALLDDNDDEPHYTQAPPKATQSVAEPQKPTMATFTYIEDDPLDLSLPTKSAKRWPLAIACSLMVVTLGAQAAFFNFDSWSRQASFRPLYAQACQWLKCELPSTYDVSKIRTTTSPQVSSHPKYQDALTVDVLFMNTAEFEQTFPNVELTFTDTNEKVVAHRIFTSDEYLAGEAAGLTSMPPQTPVHIALEIMDPGKRASNYVVRFLAP